MTSRNRQTLSTPTSAAGVSGDSPDGTGGGTFDHGQIFNIPVEQLRTPPENDALYGVVREDDPDVIRLSEEIGRQGILEPLVVSADYFILSGNRRITAARMVGLQSVPCRFKRDVHQGEPLFVSLIVSYNSQRVKTTDQQAREVAVTLDPVTAHRELVESRKKDSQVNVTSLNLGAKRSRSAIVGNRPLADACTKVVLDSTENWPLSDRQIHYLLLNNPPRLHVSKKGRYQNDNRSYRKLTNILTRLRINGEIPWGAIEDPTRPVTIWTVYPHPAAYLRESLKKFLTDYWRDLQQSQANHIELVVEKLTVQNALRPIAAEFTIPLTVGRGQSSSPPRYEMAQRFRRSGKEKLVVVIVSDLDPAGMTIAESFGRSLRDDFEIESDRLVVIKAALTKDQVDSMHLPAGGEVKIKSPTAPEFIRRYGSHVWELEAIHPDKLKQIVREAVLSVMNVERLNQEQCKEVQEAATLAGYRTAVLRTFDHDPKLDGEVLQ
jgi:hypothetical protein